MFPFGCEPLWHPAAAQVIDSALLKTLSNVGAYSGVQSVLAGLARQVGSSLPSLLPHAAAANPSDTRARPRIVYNRM
jgi:hypothetical protein